MDTMVPETGGRKPRRAATRERGRTGDDGRVKWMGYVNPTLTSAEKRAYKLWIGDGKSANDFLPDITRKGYSLKIDYVEHERAYRASLYCNNAKSENAGYCLSVFAGDWWEACNRLVYCHQEVLGGSWTSLTGKGSWKDDWVE